MTGTEYFVPVKKKSVVLTEKYNVTVNWNYRTFRQITRALSIQKRSKFVKNEHARYTLDMKKGKNLERLITATSQARF